MLLVFASSSFCVWNQMLGRNRRILVLSRDFCTYSCDDSVDRISEVIDLFLWKPYWFFSRIFSNLGSIQLSSRALITSAAIAVRVLAMKFLMIPKSPFWGEKKETAFCLFVYCVLFIDCVARSKYVIKVLSLPYFRRNFVEASSFLLLFSSV